MIIAFASIVTTVVLYIRSMDKLIEKYNTTIQQQEERFLNAQQKMQD
jgi:uridine kinase